MLRITVASWLVVIVAAGAPSVALADATTVFAGLPSVQVQEAGIQRAAANLSREKALNAACVISEIGGRFYWASRENKEMIRSVSGIFLTYHAVDGAGYVRVITPEAKSAAALLGGLEAKYDYMEHLARVYRVTAAKARSGEQNS